PWNSILGGDGAWTTMFPGKSTVIGENDVLDMWQFDYSGAGTPTEVAPCASPYTDPACNDPVGFIAPFVVDSTSTDAAHARVYAGTNRVYRTTTGGLPAGNTTSGAWVATSVDLTTGTGGGAHQADFIHTMGVGSGGTSSRRHRQRQPGPTSRRRCRPDSSSTAFLSIRSSRRTSTSVPMPAP